MESGNQVCQQNGYIMRGDENGEEFECHFSYKGFRYIRVTADKGVTVSCVEGIPVHSDLKQTGVLTCSNPIINTLQKMSFKSLLSNLVGIPTDCPHREKQGWDADTYMTSAAAMYNFDMAQFYSKWVTDLAQSQAPDGGLHIVAPGTAMDYSFSTTWPAAITFLPKNIYRFYGDKRPLEQHFDVMNRFAQSSLTRQVKGKPEIISDFFGDWMSPAQLIIDPMKSIEDACIGVPAEGTTIYGTLYHYRIVDDISNFARIIGKDSTPWNIWANRIRTNYNEEFLHAADSCYVGDNKEYRQAPNAMSLHFGVVPTELCAAVSQRLLNDICSINYRPNLGFLGAMSLMQILPCIDAEAAFKMVTQTAFPGWGYMAEQGGITMWEDWAGKASLNHPPFCLISEYFYQFLAGIQIDSDFKGTPQLTIAPQIVGDLTWVEASYHSLYGPIASSWRKVGNRLFMDIEIPTGLSATIYIPIDNIDKVTESELEITAAQGVSNVILEYNQIKTTVVSGQYHFCITL